MHAKRPKTTLKMQHSEQSKSQWTMNDNKIDGGS